MDKKTRKLLEEKARHLAPKWMETGLKRPNEKFFGLLSKKAMSLVLVGILVLEIVILLTIYLLYR